MRLLLCTLCLGPALALAANGTKLTADEVIAVEVRGVKLVKTARDVTRVAVGSSDVLDVQVLNASNQLQLTGKKLGSSALTVWQGDEATSVNVVVTHPTAALGAALKAAVPGLSELKLDSAGTSLVMSGQVANVAEAERAAEIARGFLGGGGPAAPPLGQLVNLLKVTGDPQVQLEVSFAEVSRTALRQMGMNLFGQAPGLVNGAVTSPATTSPLVTLGADAPQTLTAAAGAPLSGAFGLLFALGKDTGVPISAAVSVLSSNGYARTLAEPTLIALSGQEASFLAGGEFPVALPSALGSVQVDWKKFGVQLKFTPTIVDDHIQLRLSTTVSDLDPSIGVKLQSIQIPGVTTRSGETVVRLKDGQSFAIAGLLNDKVRSVVDKVPGLGDVPVLGMLFRSTSYRRDETELLVTVTARLVRPTSERAQLPGEYTRADPSDLELFLLGSSDSREGVPESASRPARRDDAQTRSEPVGPVGYARGSGDKAGLR